MKALWSLLLCGSAVLAASPSEPTPVPVDPAEYQRIADTRARETAAFDAQEAACYKRFAVSGCLKDVETARRSMLAKLRREEALLHEREAAAQGAEQRRTAEQKALDKKKQDEEAQANKANAAEKQKAQQDKQAAHASKPTPSASAPREVTGPSPAEQASNRASYERKLQDAERKRQEIARRLAEQKGKSAAPLPVPP